MTLQKILLLTAVLALVGACSKNADNEEEVSHPWEAQTQALEKAKGVEQMMQDAADLNRQAIEEQE